MEYQPTARPASLRIRVTLDATQVKSRYSTTDN